MTTKKTTHKLPHRAVRAVRSAHSSTRTCPGTGAPYRRSTWVVGPLRQVLQWDEGEIAAEEMSRWT